MFCPECGAEYRDGYVECYECEVPLVAELPEEKEPEGFDGEMETVAVLETGNPVLLSLAKSVLDNAGIEYFTLGEDVQFLLGGGGSGIGFNPTTGPVKLEVRPEDEDRAQALIDEIEESEMESEPSGEDVQDP